MYPLRHLLWFGLALIPACRDGTGPRLRDVTLNVCIAWQWVAYRNDDGPWTHLGPGDATYSIRVAPRVTIAYGRFQDSPPGATMHIDYLHADQLEPPTDCSPGPPGPGGQIGGTVGGLPAPQWGVVVYNGIGALVAAGSNSWQMEAQPVPATLFAARFDSGYSELHLNRVIVRRDRSYLPGSPVPLLDFDSDEAFAPQLNTVSFMGPRASVSASAYLAGRFHGLSGDDATPASDGVVPRTAIIQTIPAGRLAVDDLHVMSISSAEVVTTPDDFRTTQHYFRSGTDHAMTIAPALVAPTFSTVATAPYRRVRLQMPLQPEYAGPLRIEIAQCCSTHAFRATMHVTREHFGPTGGSDTGSPQPSSEWSLMLPDFTGMPGLNPAGMLREGEFSWYVSATSEPFGFRQSDARDGDIMRYASRRGSTP